MVECDQQQEMLENEEEEEHGLDGRLLGLHITHP